MSLDLKEIRKLAEAATPGPWTTPGGLSGGEHVVDFGIPPNAPFAVLTEPLDLRRSGGRYIPGSAICHADDNSSHANAAFIAALNPQTVLRLLDILSQPSAPTAADTGSGELPAEIQKALLTIRATAPTLNYTPTQKAATTLERYIRQLGGAA